MLMTCHNPPFLLSFPSYFHNHLLCMNYLSSIEIVLDNKTCQREFLVPAIMGLNSVGETDISTVQCETCYDRGEYKLV